MRLPLPDECLDLVWVDDGSIWLSGPETRSWPRGYPLGTEAAGVRFGVAAGKDLDSFLRTRLEERKASGLDTVTSSLSCILAWFATHPEHRRDVVERPESLRAAIAGSRTASTPSTSSLAFVR